MNSILETQNSCSSCCGKCTDSNSDARALEKSASPRCSDCKCAVKLDVSSKSADEDALSKDAAEKCPDCSGKLMSGMKYTDICLDCNPEYNKWCSSCERKLWNCMCIRPHAWD